MPSADSLRVVPLTLAEANACVAKWHRHHKPVPGAKIAIGAAIGEDVVGAAILSRPVARMSDNGLTLEITRIATDGTPNACSFLLGKCRRLALAMGYERLQTYTLPEEGGASLRAAGYRLIGLRGGGSWNVPSRPRVDTHPTQQKLLWVA